MSALSIALIVLLCCLTAGLIGLMLHRVVPEHHLNADSKDTVKLVMGLIATISGLVLGLLIASAKSSYDAQVASEQQVAADLIQFDQQLARFGPETKEVRVQLLKDVSRVHALVWASGGAGGTLDPMVSAREWDAIYSGVQDLVPRTAAQHDNQARALEIGSTIGRRRLLQFVAITNPIPLPFLIVLVLWVVMLFLGFGLFAQFNLTVMVSLSVGALSIAAAIFLILELNSPYSGLLRISDAPIQYALSRISQ